MKTPGIPNPINNFVRQFIRMRKCLTNKTVMEAVRRDPRCVSNFSFTHHFLYNLVKHQTLRILLLAFSAMKCSWCLYWANAEKGLLTNRLAREGLQLGSCAAKVSLVWHGSWEILWNLASCGKVAPSAGIFGLCHLGDCERETAFLSRAG